MPGPQYTTCVQPENYKDYVIAPELIIAIPSIVAFIATGNIPALVIALGACLSAFHTAVTYMLHGKLICLPNADSACVIGTVANIEEVGQDKILFALIDNDFSINIVLQPFDTEAFGSAAAPNQELARQGPQGNLLKVQPNMPLEDNGSPKYGGYFSTWIHNHKNDQFYAYEGEFEQDGIKEWVKEHPETFGNWWSYRTLRLPVVHCECEGSRIHDVLDALESFPGGGSKFCKKNWFTKFLCKVVATLFLPYILAKVIYKWAAADGGDPDMARLDPGSGEIEVGDTLLIKGRWVYDAAHSGYNEIHAVSTIQKLLPRSYGLQVPPDIFGILYPTWCGLVRPIIAQLAVAPPTTGPPSPGPHPGKPPGQIIYFPNLLGMTPEQEELYNNQRRPDNRWQFHPAIDGCEPRAGKP